MFVLEEVWCFGVGASSSAGGEGEGMGKLRPNDQNRGIRIGV